MEPAMSFDLKPSAIRVLGVLLEKSLSQPAYYPMTLSAITAACNQKTNREPVTAYGENDVGDALTALRRHQLASQADPERNSRAVRFRHEIEGCFDWNAAQRAIMAELMLRGPQTVGELRGRASRMTHLASTEYARELLGELERADPPLVEELPREPGRSARRFTHLLGGEGSSTRDAAVAPTDVVSASVAVASGSEPADRILKLEEEVANLKASLALMRHALRQAGIRLDDG